MDIRTVKVYWEMRKATSYSIQISNDAQEWETVKKFEQRPQVINERIVFDETETARYVRLYIDTFTEEDPDGGTTWNTVSIYELEVYSGEIKPDIKEYLSMIEVNTPTENDTTLTYTLPEFEEDGFSISYLGADYEQVVDSDLTIHKPIVDTKVFLNFEINNAITGANAFGAIPVTIPGIYVTESGDNEVPIVIPELAEWKGHTGEFAIKDTTKLIINPEYKEELNYTAESFAADYEAVTGHAIEITYGTEPAEGDFYFTLGSADAGLKEEGYLMTIADAVTVEATHKTGAFWAVQTVMQILKQTDGTMPKGITRDYPKYEVRGFMLDVGRKPFGMDYIYETVKTMAYFKLNDLGLHLNDNYIWVEKYNDTETDQWGAYSAFRLESDIKKGGNDGKNQADLTSTDLYYTKDEFRTLIQDAREMGIDIVPEFDAPAHALAFTKVRPDLAMPEDSVSRWADHLYLANPESEEFIKSVWNEYVSGDDPVFDEDTILNIGTDEYGGNNEDFRQFTANMINYVQDSGRTVRLWGSLTRKSGNTEVPAENVQMYLWNTGWANPTSMYEQGYDIINIRDGNVYMVPNGTNNRGGYKDRLNLESIYNNWVPNIINGTTIPAGSPQMLGGSYAIWNDNIDLNENGLGEYDIFDRFVEAAPYIAAKAWGDAETQSYAEFQSSVAEIGLAPNTNPYSEVKSLTDTVIEYDFDESTLKDSSINDYDGTEGENISYVEGKEGTALKLNDGSSYVATPIQNVGPVNEVSFWIKMDADATGEQIILESEKGALKAAQADTGKVGFSRENIDFSFNYELPKEEWVYLTIKGYEYTAELYVNNELTDTLGKNATGGLYATFVLPTATIGSKVSAFKGLIDELSISSDKSLEKVIEGAQAIDGSLYTEESWTAFEDALAAAQEVVANDSATNEERDAAEVALENAMKGLTVALIPTPTVEVTPTPTETAVPTPTETEVPQPTETPETTETPAPTGTPEVTETPEATETPGATEDVTIVFDDVYTDWYTDYVQYVYDNNLMTGIKGTKHFAPDANITKAQVAQVLYNMEGQPEAGSLEVFKVLKDVYISEWYAEAVVWAYNNNIVTGDLNTKEFSPNADVTREQLALMIFRYAKFKEYKVDQTSDFAGLANADKVADWSMDGVKWAVGAGLISGVEANGVKDLAPQGSATRAQVAAILQRFCDAYTE